MPFSSTALVDWISRCRQIHVRAEETVSVRAESKACLASAGSALGAGKQAVSSDRGSADAAPGQELASPLGPQLLLLRLGLQHRLGTCQCNYTERQRNCLFSLHHAFQVSLLES